MRRYNPKEIEPKWQAKWEADGIYKADEDPKKPKRYVLEYFPYPSGAAMHVGHVRNYTIGDAVVRFNRMRGHNVLHPMGWDAFGLPAENYAIKNKVTPRKAVYANTKRFKEQLMQMGFGYDWSREIDSTDPKYYKWTQWFFLLLHKRGLAYQKESLQWWCPLDKTVLANEQVEAGLCWRCGSQVVKKPLKQWFFKITEYADRLEKDLDDVNWSESIKTMQRNWIGRKEGINITYEVINSNKDEEITVFTTRPDTNYGATFVVLAPEHPFVQKVISQELIPTEGPSHHQAVQHYVQKSMNKSDVERQEEGRIKTGAFTGFYILNPLNNKKLPVWVSDFVLAGFGTGAVVGVPGHDMRDFEFAKQFDIPIERVVVGPDGDKSPIIDPKQVQEKNGKMINSGSLDNLNIHDATQKMMDLMEEQKMGSRIVSYSIRDWLISRQRYWGAPIPIIHCAKCGPVAVPEDQLPVLLPDVKSYEPSGDGRSPLATIPEFVNTICPECGGKAERETDTMDGFACSSWYFLRFADPHNDEVPFTKEKAEFWLPVDDYIGGAEHAVMHLLYARFWTKVMFDEGLINFEEPFKTLRNHGMILAPDGTKMSKSKGNTIEPGGLIDQGYGADSIRIMELFLGPWNQMASWSVEGMGGAFRFLQRVWTLVLEFQESAEPKGSNNDLLVLQHKTTAKVSKDLENLGFNTAISALMEYVNELYKIKAEDNYSSKEWKSAIKTLIQLLSPFAPHITEELWKVLGNKTSVHVSDWPMHDDKYLASKTTNIVIQINGKVRANITVPVDSTESDVVNTAKAEAKVMSYLKDNQIKKTIYIKNKLLSFVI